MPEASVPRGQTVFGQGDKAENYLLVMSGCVKVFARTDEGREVLLYRVKPGEMCTLTTACLLGRTPYPAEAVAEEDTRAKAIPSNEFDRLVSESEAFRRFVFSSFSSRLNEIMQRFEELVLASVDKRLVRALLLRADENGVIKGTHEDLALDVGTAREVISRHLKLLENRGAIRLGRGRIDILNPRLLDASD